MSINDLRKQSFIFIFLIFVAVTVLSGCGAHVNISLSNSLKKSDAKEFNIEKTAVEPIKRIDIDASTADIMLIEDDNYYVEFHYYYWEKEPEYMEKEGAIKFDDSGIFPKSYSINFDIDNYVKVYLPKDAKLDEIYINTASGDVSLQDFLADTLELQVAYGDLSIENVSVQKASINMASGNGDIQDLNVQNLILKDSYGNITLKNINTSNITDTIDLKKSDMEIALASGKCTVNNLISNTLEINNSYGDVTGKGFAVTEFNSDLSSGDLKITESTLDKADVNNSYGNVTLLLAGKEEDYELDLDTSYGKIDVNNKSYDKSLKKGSSTTKSITASLSSGNIQLQFE